MIKPDKLAYQEKAVRKIDHFNGRALIACEMRVGKTFISLQWLKKHPEAAPALVVCPEIGKLHWEDKARKYYGINGMVLNGTTPPKRKFIYGKNKLYIINWDILHHWTEFLSNAGIVSSILDEVHYIKEATTLAYQATKEIAQGQPFLLALGGTPLKSRPVELFNILNLLRPDKWPSFLKFAFRYCEPKYVRGKWQYKGAKHLDELHRNMNAWCMIRMLRKEVMNDPPKDRRIVPIRISNENEYAEAEYSFIRWLGKRSIVRAKKAKKAERMMKMNYLRRLAVELKMPGVLRWIDRWLRMKKGKIAIFAIHKEVIKQLKERYKGQCVVVDGSVRGKKRQLAVKTFQTDRRCRVFIGQTKAAGTVIELSKARAAVGIELDWTPGDVTQWEDRIFNRENNEPLRIYYLVGKDTIEHRLCEILQDKQDIISETLDGSKDKNRLSIFDELQKILLKGKR